MAGIFGRREELLEGGGVAIAEPEVTGANLNGDGHSSEDEGETQTVTTEIPAGDYDQAAIEICRSITEPNDRGLLVGQRLLALQQYRKIRQADLARETGVHFATLSHHTRKTELNPNSKNALPLLMFYRIPFEELFAGVDLEARQKRKSPSPRAGRATNPARTVANAKRKATKRGLEGVNDPELEAGLTADMLRTALTTLNAQRMSGQKVVALPIDAFQMAMSEVLRARGLDPRRFIVTADFADSFSD